MRRGETRCAFGATLITFMPELGLPSSSIFIFGSCKEIYAPDTQLKSLGSRASECIANAFECIRMFHYGVIWSNRTFFRSFGLPLRPRMPVLSSPIGLIA